MPNGSFHHFGRLQDERENELAGAKLVADLLHRRQQHGVEDAHRLLLHAGRIECRFDPVLLAVHDHVVDALVSGHITRRILDRRRLSP